MFQTTPIDASRIAAELAEITRHLSAIASNPVTNSPHGHVFEWFSDVFPVAWLRERLGLTTTEERVLWMLIAYEMCPEARRLLRELNTEDLCEPTLDTLRRAVYGGAPNARAWNELDETGRLWQLGLLERADDKTGPMHRRPVRVTARVIALAHGEIGLDRELDGVARTDAGEVAIDALEIASAATRAIETALTGSGLVIVRGGVGTGRRSVLAALAGKIGHRVLVVEGTAIATDREKAARQIRIVARECALFSLVPLILGIDALGGNGEVTDRIDIVERELRGLVMATATRATPRRWKEPPVLVELPALTGAQRARVWQHALPCATPGDADTLATLYPLAPALIQAAGKVAVRQCGEESMQPAHVQAGIRTVLDDRLAGLATRMTTTQTWDDLVLPEEQTTALVELLARIRERRRVYEDWGFAQKLGKGLGITALFSGPPGTGKTMCAGLVARDLGTELYQVDLSKIVSKWIGETEKNLAALFDAAEAGHAILLFDEADALFGNAPT
jgi:hypothetical protein